MVYKYKSEDILNFPVHQLFNVIIDIERYPEFIPWCTAVNITEKGDNKIIADVLASFKGIKGKYTSEIVFYPPTMEQSGSIEVRAIKGLFKHLYNTWELIPQNDNKTIIRFYIEFEFQSSFFQMMLSVICKHAQKRIISAFKNRVRN